MSTPRIPSFPFVRPLAGGFAILAIGLLPGCGMTHTEDVQNSTTVQLVDRAAEAGLHFVHDHGGTGRYYYVEIMTGGGGLFDFDNDGDLDLYAVQGQELHYPPETSPPTKSLRDHLYRNEGTEGAAADGVPRFVEVGEELGLEATGYGMGVATGDYDNDGWTDLYVTQFGTNLLLRNVEGQRFEDVTQTAGVGAGGMSTSAAFVDIDRDGFLDLYVTNYLRYTLATDKICTDMVGLQEYCGPQSYEGARDRLFRNRGNGTFEDITEAAGIDRDGPGLGVVTGDFDGDGWMDLYVANDQAPNHLWMNQGATGELGFREEAMYRGSALDRDGKAEASMGVEVADLDNDGDEDLFMTHLIGETNTLYLNDGAGQFQDTSLGSTLGVSSLRWTGFGCVFFDVDRDGWLDLFVANGGVRADPELRAAGDPFPYREPNLLLLNDVQGDFFDLSEKIPDFEPYHVSRGAAPGDLDNDGDMDLVVFNVNGPLRLFLNTTPSTHHWLGLQLLSPEGRDLLGATAVVTLADGRRILRQVRTTTSYLAARDPRLFIGLGAVDQPPVVEVLWLDGTRESWSGLEIDRYHRLVQGSGETP